MKIILCYVPVIHKGYIDFFNIHNDATSIFIWGSSLIALEPSLKKEIRALEPELMKSILGCAIEKSVDIAEVDTLLGIVKLASHLVLPDDAVSRALVNNVLLSMGLISYEFHPVFLRWDSSSIPLLFEVKPDVIRARSELKFLVDLGEHEAKQSSDWWRAVGSVLFDESGNVYFSSYNRHFPTEYSPYIDGDPRSSYSKGVNIELSTAIHAESQVLALAARSGVKTAGLKLLVTSFPCPVCAKLIAECGISEVFYLEGYSLVDGVQILRNAGVKIIKVK